MSKLEEPAIRLEKIETPKSLNKEATDLRDALNVFEGNAEETIRNLEFLVSQLQKRLNETREVLTNAGEGTQEKIELALQILTSSNGELHS
ncbi:hypothetical protein ACFL9T_00230 [Thermodesulfobacteriota bacterium]